MTDSGGIETLHAIPAGLAVAALILIPGAIVTALMATDRTESWWRRWNAAIWFIPAPAGFLVISTIMEILVLTGNLSVRNLSVAAAIFSVFAGSILLIKNSCVSESRLTRLWRSRFKGSGWVIVPILILILYLSITVYPFDFIYDTTDCGAYVTAGVHAFKVGSYRFIDPEIANGDADFHKSFYQITPQELYDSARNFRFEGVVGAGYVIKSFETGLLEPRYFNLYPLWIGLFVSIIGLTPGVWLATPFLALCGMSGIFLLAWALSGRMAAILSLGLFSVFVLQVWFGRYITTEMAVQAALFNGLAWLLIFGPFSRECSDEQSPEMNQNRESFHSRPVMAVAGLMIALSHFARIDTVLVMPAVTFTALLWICFARHLRVYAWFLWAYGLVTAVAIWIAFSQNESYVLETFTHVDFELFPLRFLLISFAAALILIALCFEFRAQPAERKEKIKLRLQVFLPLTITLIAAGVFYGYFIRPVLDPPDYEAFKALSNEAKSKAFPAMTLRWLGWYMTPPALFAAITGLCLMLRRKWSLHTAPFFLIAGIYCLYFAESLHCTPFHYWGMRRFITMVLPVLFIGLGYLFHQLLERCRMQRSHLLAGCILLMYLTTAGFFIQDLRHIAGFNHWKGAIASLRRIDAALPENGRLIMPGYPGIYLHSPLKMIFDRRVYSHQKNADPQVVIRLVREWLEAGDRVFVMTRDPVSETSIDGFRLVPVIQEKLYFPRMEDFLEHKPHRRGAHKFNYNIWEIISDHHGKSSAITANRLRLRKWSLTAAAGWSRSSSDHGIKPSGLQLTVGQKALDGG